MGVLAAHGKGQLVRDRLADKAGASIEELLNGGCRPGLDAGQGQHVASLHRRIARTSNRSLAAKVRPDSGPSRIGHGTAG